MTINELIKKRRSIYPIQYNDSPIAKEFIQTLLENASWAPTHRLTEPWRFKVIMNEQKKELGLFLAHKYKTVIGEDKFSEAKYQKIQNNCNSSGAIIAICMQKDLKERVPEWEEIAATAMAVQNMWLTCTANDIGCYWSSPGLIKYMDEFFKLNEHERCLGFLYIGNYDTTQLHEGKRSALEDKIEWMI